MTNTAAFYEWHPMSRRIRSIVSIFCVLACIWVAANAATAAMALIAVAFAFGAVAAQVDQRVRIDMQARDVSREITLWGRRLWSSRWRLDDFTGVGTYRIPAGPPEAPSELVHVGLRRASGGILAVRYFEVKPRQPCPEAEAFARNLAETTHRTFHEGACPRPPLSSGVIKSGAQP